MTGWNTREDFTLSVSRQMVLRHPDIRQARLMFSYRRFSYHLFLVRPSVSTAVVELYAGRCSCSYSLRGGTYGKIRMDSGCPPPSLS